jgi:cell division protease FtsH
VDAEVRRILDSCFEEAVQVRTAHRANLDPLAQQLLERETLDEAEAHLAAGLPARPAPESVPAPAAPPS